MELQSCKVFGLLSFHVMPLLRASAVGADSMTVKPFEIQHSSMSFERRFDVKYVVSMAKLDLLRKFRLGC